MAHSALHLLNTLFEVSTQGGKELSTGGSAGKNTGKGMNGFVTEVADKQQLFVWLVEQVLI